MNLRSESAAQSLSQPLQILKAIKFCKLLCDCTLAENIR